MTPTLESYDDLPYPGDPVVAMHPDRLAVIGRLHGLDTVSPRCCAVIELGCCDGGNLIPLALAYPKSRFLGLDLSRRQIEAGQAEVAALGLSNLELRHASILDVTPDWGTFDYVLCHGVYSWVPAEVQAKILSIARANLAPMGVAYVAYNTLPGWHVSGSVRALLMRATADETDRRQRLRIARETLDALRLATTGDTSPHGQQLLASATDLLQRPDYYLAHEYLEECNAPCWFGDFMVQARHAGLRFLSEAKLGTMDRTILPETMQKAVAALANDRIGQEQALDILRQRTFRQTLLCHRETRPTGQLDADRLLDLSLSSYVRPTVSSPGTHTFASPDGNGLKTRDGELVAVFLALVAACPAPIAVRDLPGMNPGLAAKLLGCLTRGFVEAHLAPADVATTPGEFSRVSPWTRRQIQRGRQVTDLRHRLIELDDAEASLIPLLDGVTPRARLVAQLEVEVASGRLVLTEKAMPEGTSLCAALGEIVEVILRNLAYQALLTGVSS